MLRRALLLLLVAALVGAGLAAGAQAADAAKARKASPRLHAFRSCSNLLTYAQRNGVRLVRDSLRFLPGRRGTGGPLPPSPPPLPVAEGRGDAGGGADGQQPAPVAAPVAGDETSQTNVQEAGVDEPDTVKAAGTRVYAVGGSRLRIVDAGASPPRVLGSLELPGFQQTLLLHGDKLLVIADIGFGGDDDVIVTQRPIAPPRDWISRTLLLEVDVADPAAPRVLRTLDVEGRFVNARLTGPTARVVLATEPRGLGMPEGAAGTTVRRLGRRWRRSVTRTRTAAWLPSSVLTERRTGRRHRRSLVRCRQVRRMQAFTGLGMLTVLTIDMEKGLPAVDADSLMTGGETVYASKDRLYVASERWLGADPSRSEILDEAATGLHAFDTTKRGETGYIGSGEVPGYLLNQWSLSEHEGVLRAATTSMPPWNSSRRSSSAVRTLEEHEGRLAEIGRVGGLGEGERIYAVRFMGDTGFVVTFRQTDPLYTLDLSEPRAPRVVGELKVPGYSAYLHPVGGGLLLGVGQDATDEGRVLGVQLSLFDVSDLRSPKRLAQRGLGRESYTEVENDHHAFLWWAPERLAVVPAFQYSADYEDQVFAGSVAFRVSRERGIEELARLPHPGRSGLVYDRSLVVGGRLLLISEEGLLATSVAAPGPGDFVAF